MEADRGTPRDAVITVDDARLECVQPWDEEVDMVAE